MAKSKKKKIDINKEYEKERMKFYSALGEAIAEWSMVEYSLFDLYVLSLSVKIESKNFFPISASYHSISGFRARLNMVDNAIISVDRDEKLLKKWTTLKSRISKKATRRNHLAHYMPLVDIPINEPRKWFYLSPPINDTRQSVSSDLDKHEYDAKKLEDLFQYLLS